MKKITLLSLISAICTLQGYAQFLFGPEGGLNLTNIRAKAPGSSISSTTKAGYKLGITGCERLGDETNFHLQFSLLYSVKGANLPNNAQIDLNYIELPIALMYKFPTVNDDHFFIGFGPYAGFMNNGKIAGGGKTQKLDIGPKGDIEGTDFGFALQAGYEFGFGLFFRSQYDLGTFNILPVSSPFNTGTDVGKIKNRAFSVTTGWLFGQNRDRW